MIQGDIDVAALVLIDLLCKAQKLKSLCIPIEKKHPPLINFNFKLIN